MSSLPTAERAGAVPTATDGEPLVDLSVEPVGLLERLALVTDPRDRRGVRYRLATLLAIGVCAFSAAGHDTMTAIADWVRGLDAAQLSRLGCPFNPLTGRYRVPDERTLRQAYSRIDRVCWPRPATDISAC